MIGKRGFCADRMQVLLAELSFEIFLPVLHVSILFVCLFCDAANIHAAVG